jgi:hypothetical protein
MADKPEGGSWGVIRYVPSPPILPPSDKVEGEFPCFLDGWFAHQDEALVVAQDWLSQNPEHSVVVVRANRFLEKGSNLEQHKKNPRLMLAAGGVVRP